jgi:hypothetical protein
MDSRLTANGDVEFSKGSHDVAWQKYDGIK